MYHLGIDVGGTNLVAAVVDDEYRIVGRARAKTVYERTLAETAAALVELAHRALGDAGVGAGDVERVGIGVPSTVYPDTQRIVFANNLGWKNVDLVGEFRRVWDIPVDLANDADCATLGESLAGAAKGFHSALLVTVGTGLGGGAVFGGKLFTGGDGYGIEPGHSVLIAGGVQCTCGLRGCAESYASVTALIRQTIGCMLSNPGSLMWEECKRDLNRVSGRTAFDAARRGDAPAQEVVDRFIGYLGAALGSMVTLLRPRAVIVGGGISNEGDNLIVPLREVLRHSAYAMDVLEAPEVLKAQLGNDAGLIGAALLHRAR